MAQRFFRRDPLGRVRLQQSVQESHCVLLFVFEFLLRCVLVRIGTARAPEDDLFEAVPVLAITRNVGLKDLSVQQSSLLHLLPTKDGGNLQQGVNVVGTVEERKAAGEERQENDTRAPHIDYGSLLRALHKHLGSTKTTGSSTVGSTARTRVCFGHAGSRVPGCHLLLPDAMGVLVATILGYKSAVALLPVCAFSLGKTKVDKNAAVQPLVVEKVRGLDIAVQDFSAVHGSQGCEQALHVQTHLGDLHVLVVVAEVLMLEVWENGDDLVLVAKGGDKRAYRVGVFEVEQQLQLVEDADGAASDVDLLDGYIVGSAG